MYRPKDWENPFNVSYIVRVKGHNICYHSLYEAGADAMLTGLRSNRESLMKADVSGAVREFLSGSPLKHGVWVFIPDEK